MPRGGQRGTDVTVTFPGARLNDSEEVLFYSPGFTVKELKPAEDGKKVTATLAIAPDCRLGEHIFRLRTKSGLSAAQSFWVGQYPSVAEKEPNSEFATPQKIAINHTVTGVVDNEDVDFFLVEAKKGQLLSVEIEAIRLGGANRRFLDAYVAIMNKERFELATADDTALLTQDAYASIVVPEDGEYVIQLRDSSYEGNPGNHYRMHVGNFPRPGAVFPPGGKVGQERDFRVFGPGGEFIKKLKLADTPQEKFGIHVEKDGHLSPSPNWIRVSPFDDIVEKEPNDARAQSTPGGALPFAFNGVIEKPGDTDWFKCSAKKGQKFRIQAYARSIRSPLDSVLNIYDNKGKRVAGNDDQVGPDSRFDFTAPADGDYFISIRDHLRKGGPDYVYRIEGKALTPSLSISIPQFARADYQSRQMIYVPRGNRTAIVVNASRSNFGGDLVFEAPNLPQGITMHVQEMPGNVNSWPIVFESAPDAPIGGQLMDLNARHKENANIRGHFRQGLDFVIANPNNTVYYRSRVEKMAAAVVEEVPFKIDIETPKVPLVQNGTIGLKVKATRKEGFDAPITLRMMWKPPGIGCSNTISIPKGKSEAVYTLNANGGAQTRTWHVAVLGESDAGKGQVLASSALTPLTVEPPYVGLKIEMAAVEQGKDSVVLCKLDHKKPFEGPAKIRLYGLPAKVECPVKEITKDDKELTFAIKTAKDTPKGQHKNLFCHVEIPQSGVTIPHNVGHGGVLRVDPPPPPKKNAPPPKKEEPKKVAAKKPAAPKPLSRLEKLRLEAKKRAEAAAKK